MKPFLELIPFLQAEDPQAVDLSALGMSDFNPYIFEREPVWLLLPLISLLLVLLHLKQYTPLGRKKTVSEEKRYSAENLL